MSQRELDERVQRAALERSLREICLSEIGERVNRYLEAKKLFPIAIPNAHFSPISSECMLLYRDGYFFACIALSQAVAEAIIRFLCKKNGLRTSGFCNNINKVNI